MLNSEPNGDVKWSTANMNLDFIKEISAGDINFGVIILKLPFKTMKLSEMI